MTNEKFSWRDVATRAALLWLAAPAAASARLPDHAVDRWQPQADGYRLPDAQGRIMPVLQMQRPVVSWDTDGRWNRFTANFTRRVPANASLHASGTRPPDTELRLGEASEFPNVWNNTVDLRPELWGELYWPADTGGVAPLAVLAHGFHEICADIYDTDESICAMYAAADPHCTANRNHLGYGYLAERLTARGFVVLSVNTNAVSCRGLGSDALNELAATWSRGLAVLANIDLLQRWDAGAPTPTTLSWNRTRRIDFGDVHLFGHSRGGEAMRAAIAQLRDATAWTALPGVVVRSLYEVAPTANATGRSLLPGNLPSAILLPACDGDVINLEGMQVFDRTVAVHAPDDTAPKATLLVHGGRHNAANTIWAEMSEDVRCVDDWEVSDVDQREIVAESVTALFTAYAGHPPPERAVRAEQFFDPRYALPDQLTQLTRIDRNYVRAPSLAWSYPLFGSAAALGATRGLEASYGPLDPRPAAVHPDAYGIRLLLDGAADASYDHTWCPPGTALDLGPFATLSLRLGRFNVSGGAPTYLPTQVRIALIAANGTLSRGVAISEPDLPVGPTGVNTYRVDYRHMALQTLAVSLADFADPPLAARGIRLGFAGPPAALALSDVWATYREPA